MKTKTLTAIAALALFGGSTVAFAHGEHSHSAPVAQGETKPGVPAHQHGEGMPVQMAQMHSRMNSMHGTGAGHEGGMRRGHRGMHETAPAQSPAPSTAPAK